jgi:hypothetical protein
MRATEIIRNILDLIDNLENSQPDSDTVTIAPEPIQTGIDTNRFKHIYAMLDQERSRPVTYDNSPNDCMASIDAVTVDAGGGVNGPKNPADMRSATVSLYPGHQHRIG